MSYQGSKQPEAQPFYDEEAAYASKAERFKCSTTAETKTRNQELYPRQGDSPELKRYLQNERTGQYTSQRCYITGEPQRQEATQGNARAISNLRKENIDFKDHAYEPGHLLHSGYKTAKNRRDNPLTGEGDGSNNWVEEDYDK